MEQKLLIDWTQMPTYNTIMAICTGAGLCSIAYIGNSIINKKKLNPESWALNFGVLGIILTITGFHMTLTWPMAKYFPFDNIIFGEPSLGFGVLLLAFAFYFWKRSEKIQNSTHPLKDIADVAESFKYILFAFGLMLIAIACAGITFQLFAAPPEEPISGEFSEYPWLEAIFISILFGFVGIIALIMPIVLKQFRKMTNLEITIVQKVAYFLLYLTGTIFILFGSLNYFTHIGLIINTVPK